MRVPAIICFLGFALTCFDLTPFSLAASIPEVPILQLKQGKVKGGVYETRGGRHYAAFLGIPYVDKPQRFQLAGPAPKWTGTRDATKFGPRCLQYRREMKEIVGSEDCLFANVYTPEFPKQEKITAKLPLPVMVFIHGGSFLFYSGEVFSPRYLLDEDVLLVTFNYRIGALGFLNTEERSDIVPNLGLKDQVGALKWVQENIASFGGDPKKVTIFGNSAGSASVSYHVLSPLSKGLFQGAISQSGTALCPWAFVRTPGKVVTNLAGKLSCPNTKTTKDTVECLKTKSAKEIVEQQQKVLGTLSADPPIPFGPSSENTFVQTRNEASDDFLPDEPENLLKEGKFNSVPYIIGVNSLDGLTFAVASIINNTRLVNEIDKQWDTLAPIILTYRNAPNPKDVSTKVREFYFAKDKISTQTPGFPVKFTQLFSDRNFFQCSQNTALEFAKQGAAYIYYMTFSNGASFLDHFGPSAADDIEGVKHQDEIQYFSPSPFFPEIKKNSPTFSFSQAIVKLWASFAADGKPTKTWSPMVWSPLSADEAKMALANKRSPKYFNIDKDLKVIEPPFAARVKFWNDLVLSKPTAPGTTSTTAKPKNSAGNDNASSSTTKKPGFFNRIFSGK